MPANASSCGPARELHRVLGARPLCHAGVSPHVLEVDPCIITFTSRVKDRVEPVHIRGVVTGSPVDLGETWRGGAVPGGLDAPRHVPAPVCSFLAGRGRFANE